MGTDIYLNWDKQSQKDRDKQSTGFSIDSGDVGYLRASIGMTQENQILRLVFPEHIWNREIPLADRCEYCNGTNRNKAGDDWCEFCDGCGWKDKVSGFPFDFKSNIQKISVIGRTYLAHAIMGTRMQEEDTPNKAMLEMLKTAFGPKVETKMSEADDGDFPFKVMWLNSLFAFCLLGIDLQNKNLNPKVDISW